MKALSLYTHTHNHMVVIIFTLPKMLFCVPISCIFLFLHKTDILFLTLFLPEVWTRFCWCRKESVDKKTNFCDSSLKSSICPVLPAFGLVGLIHAFPSLDNFLFMYFC